MNFMNFKEYDTSLKTLSYIKIYYNSFEALSVKPKLRLFTILATMVIKIIPYQCANSSILLLYMSITT